MKSFIRLRQWPAWVGPIALVLLAAGTASAQEGAAADPIKELLGTPKVMIDTVSVLIAGMLVFFMNLGFAMVESGPLPFPAKEVG